MILKHVPMRSVRKSNVVELVHYLTNTQGRQERVGDITLTNCYSDHHEAAALEILNTQARNTRARSDKTYHLILSFRAGETVPADILRTLEARVCEGLGFGEHQRVSVTHYDTDHVHLHVAINKIHPVRHTMHDPFNAYHTIGRICATLEQEFRLEQDNHQPKKTVSETRATDMERHAGTESFIGWVQREALTELREARSWEDFTQVLHQHGLSLEARGQGFVLTDGEGTFVKASSVARDLSKVSLERRLGPREASHRPRMAQQPIRDESSRPSRVTPLTPRYEPRPLRSRMDTRALYARYQQDRVTRTKARSHAFQQANTKKTQQMSAAKRAWRLQRGTIALTKSTRLKKTALYLLASQRYRSDIHEIRSQYGRERVALIARFRHFTWVDWLRQQAMAGDQEALRALRARDSTHGLQGDTLMASGHPVLKAAVGAQHDSVTKQGTIIYRVGASAVRDDGSKLQVSREVTDEGIVAALQLAMGKYGTHLAVNGSEVFKDRVARAAAQSTFAVRFTDAMVEARHVRYVQEFSKKSVQAPSPTEQGLPRTDAPPDTRTPPDRAIDAYLAERNRTRERIRDMLPHRRFEARDVGQHPFAGLRTIDGIELALIHHNHEIVVVGIDARTAQRLTRVTLGASIQVRESGSIRIGKGRRR